MKKFRKIVTVGALACTFILAIGIFSAGAVELCWQEPPPEDSLFRLNFLIELYPITSGNIPVHGFIGPMSGGVRMVVNGNGRIVGTEIIINFSTSGPRPTEPGFEVAHGTAVLDLTTGNLTVEGIGMWADRNTHAVTLNHMEEMTFNIIPCPSP
jgi:hypothetical protein